MGRIQFRGKPKIADLTSQRKLADKVWCTALASWQLNKLPECTLLHMLLAALICCVECASIPCQWLTAGSYCCLPL